YAVLEERSAQLAAGLDAAATSAGIPHTVARVGSMLTLFFNPAQVANWTVASHSDTAAFSRYFWGLIERGVYLPCSQYEALFVSTAHTAADIEHTVAAAKEVLANLR